MSEWLIVPLAAIACYSTLLVLNLMRGDRGRANLWFSLYLVSMIVWSCGSFLAHLPNPSISTLFWNRVLTTGSTTMPFVFFHFVQVFLRIERKKINRFAFLFFVIVQSANTLGLVITSAHVSGGQLINEYGSAVILPSIFWPLFIGIATWDLFSAFRKTKDSIYRNRIKYLFVSIIIIFLGTLTNSTPLSVYPIDIGFNVVAAGLIAYAILRFQLMDLSGVIRKSILYSVPTIFIGIGYFLIINFIWGLYHFLNQEQLFFVGMLVTIVSALIAQPFRDSAQLWIDRLFFRDKHDAGQMLQRVSRTAAYVLDIQTLSLMILKEINEGMHVSGSAFFMKSIDRDEFELSTEERLSIDPTMRLRGDHPIVIWLYQNDQLLSRMDIGILPQFLSMWGQERKDLEQLNSELFVPVKIKGSLVGILAIGPKRSEETFALEEYALLMALAGQIAVAVENARLYAEARRRAHEMVRLNQVIQAELSERMRAERALKESEERFRRLAENAPDLIYRYRTHPECGYEFVSPAVKEMVGYTPEEFQLDPSLQFRIIHPDDMRIFEDMTQGRLSNRAVLMRLVSKEGNIVWTEQLTVPLYDSEQNLIAVEGIARDITQRKKDEEELADRIEQLERHNREMILLNEMGELLQACKNQEEVYPIIETCLRQLFRDETGSLAIMNPEINQFVTVASWGENERASKTSFDIGKCWALRRGKPNLVSGNGAGMRCQHMRAPDEQVNDYDLAQLCVPMIVQNEAIGLLSLETTTCSEEAAEFSQSKQQLIFTVAEHITLTLINLKLNETLRQQAIRDPLTNLYNRRYMEEMLERELARAARKQSNLSIIFMDIDYFKTFNDRFGHEVGDQVLRVLGHFVKSSIRREDIACRFGGEEFVLILPDTPLESACQRAEEIKQGMKKITVTLHDHRSLDAITLSQGVSTFPLHGQSAEVLLRSADKALFQAKKTGRDRVVTASAVT